ncbi:MAG: SRPBCC family protein [Bacteroidia bacterium]|nr:SRPBCC family protein [Bacteroidia bacterium]MCC6837553.1 SRPBCC family protein [Bacteroidia bacterium]
MSLTKIESDKVEINNSAEKIFNHLSDFNNFSQLMPPQVTNWQSTADECSFTLNGMATIGMKIVEKTPNTKISISSHGKVPFEFKLFVLLTEKDASNCVGQLTFESDLNPMLKMMVEKPLGNFFNMLAQKMKDIK